ncbi:hypothetical protein LNQ81_13600 [Myroides sp. M-43]|uniref:hypothetical protein n=1 Tax=Myroides oncorhynchi TaxID=2893756 RepID=UPI001E587B30|nr:hypothetical protein [Myroides oncorhynchi]MCC9043708.1 hypothetical protein [Myroides oncorhynchi]
MKKLFFVAIAFAAFSGSALALDGSALFTLKTSTNLSINQVSTNVELVYAYLIKLPSGMEVYVQGYECALEFAEQRGGTIVGGAYVKHYEAMMCLTGPEM